MHSLCVGGPEEFFTKKYRYCNMKFFSKIFLFLHRFESNKILNKIKILNIFWEKLIFLLFFCLMLFFIKKYTFKKYCFFPSQPPASLTCFFPVPAPHDSIFSDGSIFFDTLKKNFFPEPASGSIFSRASLTNLPCQPSFHVAGNVLMSV